MWVFNDSYLKTRFSPNRFTCEGFLLLWKRCMLGPHDFTFVSACFPAKNTLDSLTAWFHICLPLVSQYTLDALRALARMILHLSPTTPWILCLHEFNTCLLLVSTCLPARSGCSECSGPHDALVSTCLPVHSACSERSGLHGGAFVSTCLPVASTCLPAHSGCSECSGALVFTCLPALDALSALVRMTRLSPQYSWHALSALVRMTAHLSPLVSQHTLDALSALVRMTRLSPLLSQYALDALSAWLQSIGGSAVAFAAIVAALLIHTHITHTNIAISFTLNIITQYHSHKYRSLNSCPSS